MTAAHATLAVNVSFLYTTILRPGGHAIVNTTFRITSLFSFGVHIQGQAIVSHPVCIKDSNSTICAYTQFHTYYSVVL